MSLMKRGKVWWSFLHRDGVRHQFSTGTTNRKKAEQVEAKLKAELHDRKFEIKAFDPDITFGAVAAHFIASGSAGPHHDYHLKFLLPFFGETKANRVTKTLAEDFRKQRREYNPRIKDATVNRDLSVLRRVLYWAVDDGLIPANPLGRLRMAPERKIRRKVLSVAEEALLLGAAEGHLYAMTLIALDTGMRRGEITTERWEDIDLSQKTLFVTHSKTPEGEMREIPLTNRLYEFLRAHRAASGLVIDFKGRGVRIVKRSWKTALKKAGIRHIRFHDLRHTFNTRLMEAGVLQEVRMALMGHANGARIHATYTHIELPVKRRAIRALEAWLVSEEENQKENTHASTENATTESGDAGTVRTEAVEEEVTRRGGA